MLHVVHAQSDTWCDGNFLWSYDKIKFCRRSTVILHFIFVYSVYFLGSLGLLDLAAALHYSHAIGAFLRKITEDPNQNISQTGSSGLNIDWDRDFRKFIQFGKYLVMKA